MFQFECFSSSQYKCQSQTLAFIQKDFQLVLMTQVCSQGSNQHSFVYKPTYIIHMKQRSNLDGDNRCNLHHLCIYKTSLLDERWVLPFDQCSHAKHLRHKTSPPPLLSEQHTAQGGFVQGNQSTSSFSVKTWQSKSHELSPGDILQHFLNTNKNVLCLILFFFIQSSCWSHLFV